MTIESGSDEFVDHEAALRDTVIKSGFAGVAATVLAVVVCSPAGLGGMIGTSVAGLGWNSLDPNNTGAESVTFPTAAPLTQVELQEIRDRLVNGNAALDNMRAATDAQIDFMRSIAANDNPLSVSPSDMLALDTAGAVRATSTPEQSVAEAPVDRDLELAELLLPKLDG